MTLPHLPSYPRLKGPPWTEPDAPGSAPDHPIPPPEGTTGLSMLCYGKKGWQLVPLGVEEESDG